MAFWYLIVFVTSPMSTLFAVFEKQRTFLYMNILLICARTITLIAGGFVGNARLALLLYTAVSLIIWIYICLWILHKSEVLIMPIIRKIAVYLCYCMPTLFLIILGKYILHLSPPIIIILSIGGGIFYYALVLRQDEFPKSYLFRILSRSNLK
jgi:lipopolysaccharide exporter